jgi:hypothetical protein
LFEAGGEALRGRVRARKLPLIQAHSVENPEEHSHQEMIPTIANARNDKELYQATEINKKWVKKA